MSKETLSGSFSDPLNKLRRVAEDPSTSSEITLIATYLIAEEVVTREGKVRSDRGLSPEEVTGIRGILDSHQRLLTVESAGLFNTFLDEQTMIAESRSQHPEQDSQNRDLVKDPFIEGILKPLSLSIWLSRQGRLPFRKTIANIIEDVKLAVAAPIVLARGIRREMGNIGPVVVFSPHIVVGLTVSLIPQMLSQAGDSSSISVGILAAAASYMGAGYLLTQPGRKNIAPYRQKLNNP